MFVCRWGDSTIIIIIATHHYFHYYYYCQNYGGIHRPTDMMMRSGSGSSELLLEQQEQELRLRNLKLAAPKKSHVKKETCKERLSFYLTSSLVFLSVSAGASLLFLVPLYVDPAISTLAHLFIDVPTLCTTTRREDLTGIFNCTWSSCREGCTSDIYRCTHIYVSYLDFGNLSLPSYMRTEFNEIMRQNYYEKFTSYMNDANTTSPFLQLTQNLSSLIYQESHQSEEAMLMVNIKGCGYLPCKTFTEVFGVEGLVFPCYYSRLNKTLVLTRYNRDDQLAMIVHFFACPFVICVIASILLCILHCDCRCQKEKTIRRRPRIGDLR